LALGLRFMLAAQGVAAPDHALIAWGGVAAQRKGLWLCGAQAPSRGLARPSRRAARRRLLRSVQPTLSRDDAMRNRPPAGAALAGVTSRDISPPWGLPKRGRWRLA
jgi:hypothetical protein